MPLSQAEPAVWRRILLRSVLSAAPSIAIAFYALSVIQPVGQEDRTRAIGWAVLAILLAWAHFSAASWWIVRSGLTGAGGTRLARILELPRRIELLASTPAWLTAATVFGAAMMLGMERGGQALASSLAVGFFSSLLPGILLVHWIEADLLPLALQEHALRPEAFQPRRGVFWPRQSWYLPYAFGVALLSLLVLAGTVLVGAFRNASERLGAVLTLLLSAPEVAETVSGEVNRLASAAGLQVLTIASILLVLLGLSGWAMARRQARAALSVQAALRALAAGAPRPPTWVATDEIGDVAVETAGISREMEQVFAQLKAMAAGDLGGELRGDSGLVEAFRRSQEAMRELVRRMEALSRGEMTGGERVAGDLGAAFERLQRLLDVTAVQAQTISDGDLRTDADVPGKLGAALQRMTGNLRAMVSDTQSASARVSDIVVTLQSAAAQLSASTTEQASAVTETANTMTEMAQTSAVSADRATELIRQGEAASTVVDEGAEAAARATGAMNRVAESLKRMTTETSLLAERVRRIDEITETVTFLADQSSTLAINAAIEAARAGEAGKGFAVVAREIRTLAADSRKAAGQIKGALDDIRQQTGQVSGMASAGATTIEDVQRQVEQLAQGISHLGVTVHEAVGLMRQVEGSARQHQIGVSQVTHALSQMQKASESIRDGSRLLGELSTSARGMSTALHETASAYVLPGATPGARPAAARRA